MGCISSSLTGSHAHTVSAVHKQFPADFITDDIVMAETKPEFDLTMASQYLNASTSRPFVVFSVSSMTHANERNEDGSQLVSSRDILFKADGGIKTCRINEYSPPEDGKTVQEVLTTLKRQPSRRITVEQDTEGKTHVVVTSKKESGEPKRHQSYSLGKPNYWTVDDQRSNTIFSTISKAIQYLLRTHGGIVDKMMIARDTEDSTVPISIASQTQVVSTNSGSDIEHDSPLPPSPVSPSLPSSSPKLERFKSFEDARIVEVEND